MEGRWEKNNKRIERILLHTPRSRVLLEKLTGSHLVKKFPSFYGTRRFITAFTSACHLSLSWASMIHSIPPLLSSWRSIIILSSPYAWVIHVVSFPRVFPPNPCNASPLPCMCYTSCPSHERNIGPELLIQICLQDSFNTPNYVVEISKEDPL